MEKQRKDNYLSRFNGLNLSEEQLERQWRIRMEEEESLRIAEAINMRLMNQQSNAQYAAAGGKSGGCIQMVFETANYDTAEINVEVSGDTSYTISWGDGSTDSGDLTTGGNQISHTYATHGAGIQYTAELCFGDPSAVTELNFVGDD